MRLHFISRLALLIAGSFLVVALIVHEWGTERVVQELRVTHHDDVRRRATEPANV